MSFIKPLAKVGTFGLAGLAASGGKKRQTQNAPVPSMITAQQTPMPSPSMVSKPSIY